MRHAFLHELNWILVEGKSALVVLVYVLSLWNNSQKLWI